jgi:hypothetical protein
MRRCCNNPAPQAKKQPIASLSLRIPDLLCHVALTLLDILGIQTTL